MQMMLGNHGIRIKFKLNNSNFKANNGIARERIDVTQIQRVPKRYNLEVNVD